MGSSFDKKPYSALDVAEYCLYYCTKKEKPISNLQLQKILYYVQANFLVKLGVPCFRDAIVAWKYGPVVEDVYYYYRDNVADAISISSYDGGISEEDKPLVNEVCDSKSKYNAGALVGQTHNEDPWGDTYVTHASEIIEIDRIRAYFLYNPHRITD
jgi:uncharacterized phage-associated protein